MNKTEIALLWTETIGPWLLEHDRWIGACPGWKPLLEWYQETKNPLFEDWSMAGDTNKAFITLPDIDQDGAFHSICIIIDTEGASANYWYLQKDHGGTDAEVDEEIEWQWEMPTRVQEAFEKLIQLLGPPEVTDRKVRAKMREWITRHELDWKAAKWKTGEEAVVWWWAMTQEVPLLHDMGPKDMANMMINGFEPLTFEVVVENIIDFCNTGESYLEIYITMLTGFYLEK